MHIQRQTWTRQTHKRTRQAHTRAEAYVYTYGYVYIYMYILHRYIIFPSAQTHPHTHTNTHTHTHTNIFKGQTHKHPVSTPLQVLGPHAQTGCLQGKRLVSGQMAGPYSFRRFSPSTGRQGDYVQAHAFASATLRGEI